MKTNIKLSRAVVIDYVYDKFIRSLATILLCIMFFIIGFNHSNKINNESYILLDNEYNKLKTEYQNVLESYFECSNNKESDNGEDRSTRKFWRTDEVVPI